VGCGTQYRRSGGISLRMETPAKYRQPAARTHRVTSQKTVNPVFATAKTTAPTSPCFKGFKLRSTEICGYKGSVSSDRALVELNVCNARSTCPPQFPFTDLCLESSFLLNKRRHPPRSNSHSTPFPGMRTFLLQFKISTLFSAGNLNMKLTDFT
jgi:hypothetical protein